MRAISMKKVVVKQNHIENDNNIAKRSEILAIFQEEQSVKLYRSNNTKFRTACHDKVVIVG